MTEHTPTIPTPVAADRAVGAVLGSAAGDALGAHFEFGPPLPTDTPVDMIGGGAFGWAPGEWTDDTQMALAILDVLATGSNDRGEVEAAFRRWYDSGPADVGNQTSAVLRQPGSLTDAALRRFEQRPDSSAGNGSLMRTGPVALAHPQDPEAIAALARDLSALTHADPDCVDACVLWSVAIDHTIHHAPASDEPWDWTAPLVLALDQLEPGRRDRWAALITEAAGSQPTDFPRNGWVIHAFQAALAAICSTPVPDDHEPGRHLQQALEHAVRAGGDTDTVAAIAGSMLGARWGATAVPFKWRGALNGRSTYTDPTLTVADLDRLARLTHRGGQPDGNGWPGRASMLDHYRNAFPAEPLVVELDGVRFGNAAGLQLALDGGADAVVSLCRMGTQDVPEGVEHHVVGMLDTTSEENPNLVLLLADTTDGIAALVDQGRTVFVHCVAAENRTPTVAAAWLCRHHGMDPIEALEVAAAQLNEPKPFLRNAVGLSG